MDDCRFSPDGKWLATGVDGGRLYAVGTWKPGPQLGHGGIRGFSEDGSTALLSANEGYLRLVEVGTGHELARFEGPESYKQYAAMTADGTKLLEPEKDGIRVWDCGSSARSSPSSGWTGTRHRSRPRQGRQGRLTVTIIGAELLDPDSPPSRMQRLLAPWLKGSKADSWDYLLRADELVYQGWHDLALREL